MCVCTCYVCIYINVEVPQIKLSGAWTQIALEACSKYLLQIKLPIVCVCLVSCHAAVLLLRPQCHDNGSASLEAASSGYLEDSPAINSTLVFPESLFMSVLDQDNFTCAEVGVVAVVYNGAGALLSFDFEFEDLQECMPTQAPLANGKW